MRVIVAGVIALTVWAAEASPILTKMRSVRCQGEVVMVGDSSYSLHEKCGEPDWSEVVGVQERQLRLVERDFPFFIEEAGRQALQVEYWYYRGGAGRLNRKMTIVGGELTQIEITGRD